MQAVDVFQKGRIAVVTGVVLVLARLGMFGGDSPPATFDMPGGTSASARPAPGSVPSDRYDQLQQGMTYQDVVALIGPPARRDRMALPGATHCTWGEGAGRIEAVFKEDGQLFHKVLSDRYHLECIICPGCRGLSKNPAFPDCPVCSRLGVVLQELEKTDGPVGHGPIGGGHEEVSAKKTCSLCGGSGQHQRTCYRCDNGYTYEGTGTRMTCSNCSGSGHVQESCTHCGGSGYTWE